MKKLRLSRETLRHLELHLDLRKPGGGTDPLPTAPNACPTTPVWCPFGTMVDCDPPTTKNPTPGG